MIGCQELPFFSFFFSFSFCNSLLSHFLLFGFVWDVKIVHLQSHDHLRTLHFPGLSVFDILSVLVGYF